MNKFLRWYYKKKCDKIKKLIIYYKNYLEKHHETKIEPLFSSLLKDIYFANNRPIDVFGKKSKKLFNDVPIQETTKKVTLVYMRYKQLKKFHNELLIKVFQNI